jgi:predicted MFS family arabinose efflux permease
VLGVICGATSFGVMSLVMTATPISMHHHQGLSLADTSSVIQWHIVAMFLPSLLTGYFMQRMGVYWMALAGLLLNVACVYFALSGVSMTHYLGALVLLGAGWNALFMAGTQMVATAHPGPERFQAQANNDFVVFAVQGVASLSAGFLLAMFGWQGLNLVALAMLLACFMAWIYIVMVRQFSRVRTA